MNRWLSGCLLTVLFGAGLGAQQPNGPFGSMNLNSVDGPPFPILQTIGRGTNVNFRIGGLPNARFVTFGSSSLSGVTFPFQGQFVDLNLAGLFTVLNGFATPGLVTDNTGIFSASFPVGQTVALNSTAAYQSAVENPAAAGGFSFTAAVRVTIVPGLVTQNLTMTDDSTSAFSLVPFGLTFPFYSQTYTTIHVCSNGFVNFGPSGDTNFNPTPADFLTGAPRVAGFWCDLNPGISGTISVQIDQSLQVPTIDIRYLAVAEFGVGNTHTFTIRLNAAPVGDIQIINSPQNGPSLFNTTVVGIGPGGGLGNQAQKNLSFLPMSPVFGVANEHFFEVFTLPSGASPGNPFDLTATTLNFFAVGPGAVGASYIGN